MSSESDLPPFFIPDLPPSADDAAPAITPYHRAAAVLAHFDPDRLKPMDEPASDADFRSMLGDSVVLNDPSGVPVWSLRLDVRQKVLQAMHSPAAMLQALDANPDREQNEIQRVFETCLRGETIDLDAQTPQELAGTARVVEWAGGLIPSVPPLEALQTRLERDQLLAPFRSLADKHFRGRTTELDDLRDYVGVLPPTTVLRRAIRAKRSLHNLLRRQERPLLLLGTGGVGKSALLARFILEHADAPAQYRFPFVYLDFDRPELLAEEPLTLVAEAARQLGSQYPAVRPRALALRQKLLNELYAAHRARGENTSAALARRRREWAPPTFYSPEIGLFYAPAINELLDEVTGKGEPLVLILDTFEQVQYRGHRVVELLGQFLERLRDWLPQMRVVISGRAPIEGFEVDTTPIGPLDTDAAIEHLRSLGVDNEELAQQIVDKVGGHPLCLRLAARLALSKEGGIQSLRDLKTRNSFFFRPDAEMIQGMLYERLLQHIDDAGEPQMNRLAHPGLVLRRVTPGLIEQALAGPCRLDLTEPGTAQRLFDALAAQVWVVERQQDGSLRHRVDLRAIMLPLLQKDEAAKVAEIHQAAVRYYEGREPLNPIERAEEIYHRLMLGHDAATLQSLWMEDVQGLLWQSYHELPAGSRVLLATLSGERVDPTVKAEADQEAWEKIAAREAASLLQSGKAEDALKVLQERLARTKGSALYAIEAEALAQLGDASGARAALASGIDSAYSAGALSEVLPLVLRKAEMECEHGIWPFAVTVENPAGILRDEYEALATRNTEDPSLLRLGALRLAQMDAFNPALRTESPPASGFEVDVMRLWERFPAERSLDVMTQFLLLGTLTSRFSQRAVVRVTSAFPGSHLASLAVSEEGTSRRQYRHAIAQLAPLVDDLLGNRATEEGQTGTLRTAEGTPDYSSKALTYGKLIDELIAGLPALDDNARRRFAAAVVEAFLVPQEKQQTPLRQSSQ